MFKKNIILYTFLFFNLISAFPQAGRGVYRFLELPVSSRAAAVGGHNVSLRDNDVNFALMNPALLTMLLLLPLNLSKNFMLQRIIIKIMS